MPVTSFPHAILLITSAPVHSLSCLATTSIAAIQSATQKDVASFDTVLVDGKEMVRDKQTGAAAPYDNFMHSKVLDIEALFNGNLSKKSSSWLSYLSQRLGKIPRQKAARRIST